MPKQSRVILGNGPGSTGQVGIDPATSTALAWSLACIIIVSAGVRLYHLGVPSLWWDEILACSVARNSLSYIFDRSLHIDLYSPLFYLVVKCGQFVDMGDGVARLPFGRLRSAWRRLRVYRLGAGLIGPRSGPDGRRIAGSQLHPFEPVAPGPAVCLDLHSGVVRSLLPLPDIKNLAVERRIQTLGLPRLAGIHAPVQSLDRGSRGNAAVRPGRGPARQAGHQGFRHLLSGHAGPDRGSVALHSERNRPTPVD